MTETTNKEAWEPHLHHQVVRLPLLLEHRFYLQSINSNPLIGNPDNKNYNIWIPQVRSHRETSPQTQDLEKAIVR